MLCLLFQVRAIKVIKNDGCLGHYNQELKGEQTANTALRLGKDNLERVVMARLMEAPSEQWPVFYLVSCYARASDEVRAASALHDASATAAVQAALLAGKQLAVSYTGLLLSMDLLPQVCQRKCISCSLQ